MAYDPTAKETILGLIGKGEGFGFEMVAELLAPLTAAATPTVSARYKGDKYYDSNAGKWYLADSVGNVSPADDWTILN
jgi:hypothetical protein